VTAPPRAVAARAASLLLRYPDPEVRAALPTITAALAELPVSLHRVARPLRELADHLAHGDPRELATAYVDTFDFRRRCTLYLTYYSHGDTRGRGRALAEVAAAYRAAGFAPDERELPDHLPTLLELAAAAGEPGWQLLHALRVGLDLLTASLERDHSPYAPAVAAVRDLLPPPGPEDAAAAHRIAAAGPPTELVGLEPFTATSTPTAASTGGRR
jgi:nitrate reductase delta subunit